MNAFDCLFDLNNRLIVVLRSFVSNIVSSIIMVQHKFRNKNYGKTRPVKVPMRKDIAKKKKAANNEENEQQENEKEQKAKVDIGVVKLSFNKIVRKEYAEEMTTIFKDYADNGTRIMHLASLVMLFKVNDAFDREDWSFFFQFKWHTRHSRFISFCHARKFGEPKQHRSNAR